MLHTSSTVYEAARAMEDNRVGAVLVSDHGRLAGIVTDRDVALAVARDDVAPKKTRLSAVMTDVVGACAEDASVADILTTMRQYACRRVPLVRAGRPVAIVTLDDLVLAGQASSEDVAAIVEAQLELPARLKPAGSVHPAPRTEGSEPDTRAEAAHWALVRTIERVPRVGSPERAQTAIGIVLDCLHRRMPDGRAERLSSLLPPRVRAELDGAAHEDGITLDTIAAELGERLGILPDATLDILLAVWDSLRARGADEELCGTMREVLRG